MLAHEDHDRLHELAALVRLLRPHWPVVGMATSPDTLAELLDIGEATLCIVDMRLQGTATLALLEGRDAHQPTICIASDAALAAEAFDGNALDFLTWPIRPERLEHALRKADRALAPVGVSHPPIVRMLKGQEVVLGPLAAVRYFQAQRKYTRVVFQDQEGLLRMGLSSVAEQLRTGQFLRVHRSVIVNLAQVQWARRDELGRMAIGVAGRSESLVIARGYEHLFRDGIF